MQNSIALREIKVLKSQVTWPKVMDYRILKQGSLRSYKEPGKLDLTAKEEYVIQTHYTTIGPENHHQDSMLVVTNTNQLRFFLIAAAELPPTQTKFTRGKQVWDQISIDLRNKQGVVSRLSDRADRHHFNGINAENHHPSAQYQLILPQICLIMCPKVQSLGHNVDNGAASTSMCFEKGCGLLAVSISQWVYLNGGRYPFTFGPEVSIRSKDFSYQRSCWEVGGQFGRRTLLSRHNQWDGIKEGPNHSCLPEKRDWHRTTMRCWSTAALSTLSTCSRLERADIVRTYSEMRRCIMLWERPQLLVMMMMMRSFTAELKFPGSTI